MLFITSSYSRVATALTVYGIETAYYTPLCFLIHVATALTVYGIETVYREEKPGVLQPG